MDTELLCLDVVILLPGHKQLGPAGRLRSRGWLCPPAGCVTFGKCLNLSELQFLVWKLAVIIDLHPP